MLPFLGSLISAGSGLLGGIFNRNSQEQINQQNIQNQQYINAQNIAFQQQENAENIAEQEKFAKSGIQWRVQDANAAGINPLAALGASTQSFTNVIAPQASSLPAGKSTEALGDAMGKAGQDIGRAVAAQAPQLLRQQELENKLLEAKIANISSDTIKNMSDSSQMATRLGQPGTPPPLPTADPRGPVINLMQRARDPRTGEIVWIPSKDAASPLQTLGATPVNAALAGRGVSEGLLGLEGGTDRGFGDLYQRFMSRAVRGDAERSASQLQYLGQ